MGFVISVLVMYWAWGYHSLPAPSSEHGSEIDSLWNLSMLIINVVFFIVQPILFYFGYKYRGKKGTKAVYYEHNNKLELFGLSFQRSSSQFLSFGVLMYGVD